MPKDVKVRLLDAPSFLDRDYDYSVPDALDAAVQIGGFVTVPFGGGNRRYNALVLARCERDAESGLSLKPVLAVPTPHVRLSDEMLGLAAYSHFLCSHLQESFVFPN